MLNKGASQGHLLKESWLYPSSPACLRLPSETCHSHFPRPLPWLAPVAARLMPPLKSHHPASRSATHYRRDDCGRGLRIHILLSDKPRLSRESQVLAQRPQLSAPLGHCSGLQGVTLSPGGLWAVPANERWCGPESCCKPALMLLLDECQCNCKCSI